MSIAITTTDVTIDNQTVTFEDIYQYAVSINKTSLVNKLGNAYLLKTNLKLQNGATVQDINKAITIEGKLIQIPTGCTLRLGERRTDLSTLNGCTLSAPNIENAYGFGATTTTASGNLLLYNSTINIFGFWSFFKGDNLVEIIDCFIDGFGRISGVNSILKNIIFKKAHGKYGGLATMGNILLMKDIYSYDVLPYYDSYEKATVKCALYHNPQFAPNVTMYYGEFSNYESLLYVESMSSGSYTFELRGTKVTNGYSMYKEVGSKTDFKHSFRFKPKILDSNGATLMDVNVVIKDKTGAIVLNANTDNNGNIDTWLTYCKQLQTENTVTIMTPHTITLTSGDITSELKLYVNDNFEDFPMYLQQSGGVSCSELDDKLNSIISKVDSLIEENNYAIVV